MHLCDCLCLCLCTCVCSRARAYEGMHMCVGVVSYISVHALYVPALYI